jgi:hypothetical protein
MPSISGVNDTVKKDLLNWDLSRQVTHATLTLSALLGLFTILTIGKSILEKGEIRVIFTGFLTFLSYEYFKLLRSFQVVNLLEGSLYGNDLSVKILPLDLIEKMFSHPDNLFLFNITLLMLSVSISIVVVLLIRIYIHIRDFSDKSTNST